MRWVWRYDDYAEREQFGRLGRIVLPPLVKALKKWDLKAAEQPDFYIANSEVTAGRIKDFYGRESLVIPPPIDVTRFNTEEPDEDYYLLLSRLLPYKRLDLAVEACKQLDRRLVVIGDGPARRSLEEIAGPKTTFLGRQSDNVVAKYAGRCRALIFPGEEDFGMTPLEINSAGRPVIAYGAGGARETVIEGRTGVFFEQQTPASVMSAIRKFETLTWDKNFLRRHAEGFSSEIFASRIREFVAGVAPDLVTREFMHYPVAEKFAVEQTTAA
jgi:glycosyltransferase involved in cell wall biosynthesis